MKRYIKTEWIDDRTPVNAKNLNKIEDALETLSIDSLDISKIQGVNGIKVVTKDDGGVEISGNIQVVPEVEGQSYDTGKVYFVLDPGTQKVKGLVVAGEFTKLGGEGDGTGDSPLGRVTFRVTTLEDTLGTLETRIGSLETKVQGLEETEILGIKTRLGEIESRPGVNLEPVNTKIGQLENRIGTLESRPGTDNNLGERVASLESTKNELVSKDSNLEGRISALESKTGPNLEPLETRLSILEKREVPNIQPLETRVQNLESRPVPENLDTLKSRVSVLEAKETPSLEPVNTKISGIDERVKVLESRPPVDLNPLETRVQTLEGKTIPDISPLTQRVEVLERKETPDLGPLTNRVKALEDKTIPDVEPIKSRLDVLEGKEIPDIRPVTERVGALERRVIPDIGPLTDRVGVLETEKSSVSGRLDALESRPVPENLESIKSRLGALESRPIETEKGEVDLSPITSRITALEEAPKPVDYSKDIEGVKGKIGGLESRIGTLETRPGPDLEPLENRIGVLEAKPNVDLGPLTGRVDTLERREIPNLGPLETRVDALENKPEVNLEPLNIKITGLDERVKVVEGKTIPDLAPVNSKITALEESKSGIETRLGVLEGKPGPDLSPLENRIQTLESKTIPDIAPLTSRIETLEGREIPSLDPVNNKLGEISQKVSALESKPEPDFGPVNIKITGLTSRVETLEGDKTNLTERIQTLESRDIPNLSPITSRVEALENKPDLGGRVGSLESKVQTLEGRTIPDISPIESRIGVLEAKPGPDFGPVNTKISGLTGRIETLESKPAINLTPLAERVTALENRPTGGATSPFPKGNYDKSRYNRTVTEEEVEKMLRNGTAPEHRGDSEQAAVKFSQLPEHLRAACCAYECPTAEKIMLKGGTEFIRLTDTGYDRSIFCNTTTLEVFVFKRDYIDSNEQIVVYPYNMVTAKMSLSPKSSLVTSISVSNYDIYLGYIGRYGHTDILEVLADEDPVRRIQEGMLSTKQISGLSEYFTSDHHIEWMYDKFILETNTNDRYIRLKQGEIRQLFGEEPCTAFKNIADGTLYKLETVSKRYDNASEIGLPMPDIKYFKGYVLGQIPGIPGTYTISEEFYADMRETMNMVIPVFPTTPKPIEPVADQIKKLLALSQSNPNSSTSTEIVNLQPLTDRVVALENAPKPVDRSQEITALQGTVAEHATSISSNSQRITALENKPAPASESVDLKALKERIELIENYYLLVLSWVSRSSLRITWGSGRIDGKYETGKSFPVSVELPEGVYAYTIDENQDLRDIKKYKLLGEDGKIVPANTPVILMSVKNTSESANIVYSSKSINSGLLGPMDRLKENPDYNNFDYYQFYKGEGIFKKVVSQVGAANEYLVYLKIPKDYVYKPAVEPGTTES